METRHLLIIILANNPQKKMESKTKFQKICYFLSNVLEIDLGFKPHFYGPYSPFVENSLGEIVNAGFVKVNKLEFGLDINRGFEIKKFEYILNDSGMKIYDYLKNSNEEFSYFDKNISELLAKINSIDGINYMNISIAAKIHYILKKSENPMGEKEIIDSAEKLNWKIDQNDINKAIDILKELNLVSLN
jgi:uncharacterized protein